MGGFLNGLVTFERTNERRRARNAVEGWVANYNQTHPNAVFVGSCTDTTAFDEGDPDKGIGPGTYPALQCSYICSDYQGVADAMVAIATDVNANAFINILNLSTGSTA